MKIIKQIHDFQKNFLRGGATKERKWELVVRDKICDPNEVGGISIIDHLLMGKDLVEKYWCRWLKEQGEIWGMI